MDHFYLYAIGAYLLIGIAFIASCIAGAETYIEDDNPIEAPGTDYNYSERPYYER